LSTGGKSRSNGTAKNVATPFQEGLSMKKYDAEKAPSAAEWLALDEHEQVTLIEAYHKRIKAKLPNRQIHALAHVVVENQLAEGIEVVGEAVERLVAEGLDRHEAIHAIGSVLMEHLRSLMQGTETGPDHVEQYFQEVKSLTKAGWYESTIS